MSGAKNLPPRMKTSRCPATQPSLADEAVSKIADERDYIQKKVFTKWCNVHLSKVNGEIEDLFEDFRNGKKLLLLLELLTDEKLPRQRGSMRFHYLQNVSTALEFMRSRKIKLINIRNDDIVDGNSKLTLGLVWTIILHFQISQVQVLLDEEKISPKASLLSWCKAYCDGYSNVNIKNFTTSWSDGLAFNVIIHRHRPDLIDYESIEEASPSVRLENAFSVAERELGIHRLLDVEDVTENPDDKSIVTYVSSIRKVLPSKPPRLLTQQDEDLKTAQKSYCERAVLLVKWIKFTVVNLDNREMPPQLLMVQDIYNQSTFLKINVLPQKDAERRQIYVLYKEIQTMDNPMNRKLDIPDDITPGQIDVLWAQLLAAQENRHLVLKTEIERLDHLSHIAEKFDTDAALVESSLNDVEKELEAVEQKMEETTIDSATKVIYLQKLKQVNKALTMFKLSIDTMTTSVEILVEGNYHNNEDTKTRVNHITIHWEQLQKRINLNIQNLIGTRTSTSSPDKENVSVEEPIVVDEQNEAESAPMVFDEAPTYEGEQKKGHAEIPAEVLTRGSKAVIVTKPKNTTYKIKVEAAEEGLIEPSQMPVAEEMPMMMEEKPAQSSPSADMVLNAKPVQTPPTKIKISSKREAVHTPDVPKKKLKKSIKSSLTAPWNCAGKSAGIDSSDEDSSQPFDAKPVPGWPDMTLNAKLQEIRVAHHWIQFRKSALENNEYGMDLPTNEKYLVENEKEFQEIRLFKIEVEKVCELELCDPPEELKDKITELQDAYSLLVIVIAKRHKFLTELVKFMKGATQQLIWMNQKEEIEVSRDWSDKDIDLGNLEKYNKALQLELIPREEMINDVVNSGQDLIKNKHPAPAAIEAYITVLQSQWSWVCQLQIAYKTHHKNTAAYQKFFTDAISYEKWLMERVNRLQPMLNGVDMSNEDTLVSLIHILLFHTITK